MNFKKLFSSKTTIISIAIVLAALSRLIPHLPNFTPIAAMALFGGAFLENKKLAFVIPFVAMITSDIILGFHNTMWGVYLGFTLTILLGIQLTKNMNVTSVITYSLGSSIIFFIISNFAVWTSGYYPTNFVGLVACYVSAIPFFGYSILGDLFYSTVLFGSFFLLKQRMPAFAS